MVGIMGMGIHINTNPTIEIIMTMVDIIEATEIVDIIVIPISPIIDIIEDTGTGNSQGTIF